MDNNYFSNIWVESWHYTSTTFVNGTCNASGFPAWQYYVFAFHRSDDDDVVETEENTEELVVINDD